MPVAAILAVAFRCPYEGPVNPARGPDAGRAAGRQRRRPGHAGRHHRRRRPRRRPPTGGGGPGAAARTSSSGFHGHDTRGLGVANVLAGVEAGLDGVDSSVGGLGGCPFAGRGASGNVASEEVVGLLDAIGIDSGVDVDRLAAVAAELEQLLGHPLPSRRLALYKATGSAR